MPAVMAFSSRGLPSSSRQGRMGPRCVWEKG